ncbi:MAG: energy transducer TonB [Bacteroidales bacterium]|nr:energy transducer TonB [Bacteroidales bacterium]
METKKSARASLENKRLLFTEVGFVVALGVLLFFLEASTAPSQMAVLADNTMIVDEDDILAIQMPEPPKVPELPELPQISDNLDIVEDDIKLDDVFVNLTEENGQTFAIPTYKEPEIVEEEEEEEVLPVMVVEVRPTFNGGEANEFSKWVNSRLVYPEPAKEMGLQGRVTLQFTIGTDGRVSDVRVLKGADPILDQEAVRVVSSSPRWSPGKQRDRAVKVSYTFPVIFRLR